MEGFGKKSQSLEEADRQEDDYYRNLSPDDRVALLLQIVAQYRENLDETSDRFERVFRVTTLEES